MAVTCLCCNQEDSGFQSGCDCACSLFLQYVDRGILQLTPDFILQLLDGEWERERVCVCGGGVCMCVCVYMHMQFCRGGGGGLVIGFHVCE